MNHQNSPEFRYNKPKEHPEIAEVEWIDDAFYIEKPDLVCIGVLKNGDGFLTGGTYDGVLHESLAS